MNKNPPNYNCPECGKQMVKRHAKSYGIDQAWVCENGKCSVWFLVSKDIYEYDNWEYDKDGLP